MTLSIACHCNLCNLCRNTVTDSSNYQDLTEMPETTAYESIEPGHGEQGMCYISTSLLDLSSSHFAFVYVYIYVYIYIYIYIYIYL